MRNTKGFTLVELMLAMTFLSILLIMIALLTIQVSNIYTKGTTLKAVNQAGVELESELRSALNQASSGQVEHISYTRDGKTVAGRLCTGTFSYAWNYGEVINAQPTAAVLAAANLYATGSNDSARKDVRFVKVANPGGSLCTAQENGKYPEINPSDATELLKEGDRNLVLHDIQVNRHALQGNQAIFSVYLLLGTNNQDEFIEGQTQCRPPSDGFDEFCAVNKLEFTARAANSNAGGQL